MQATIEERLAAVESHLALYEDDGADSDESVEEGVDCDYGCECDIPYPYEHDAIGEMTYDGVVQALETLVLVASEGVEEQALSASKVLLDFALARGRCS